MFNELFSVEGFRKALLGVAGKNRPTAPELARDAALVTRFANSQEYQIWAEEAWATVATQLQLALSAKSDREANIALGAVRGAMELLSTAYKARREHERLAKEVQAQNATSRR